MKMIFASFFFLAALAACEPRVDTIGHVDPQHHIKEVHEGKTTKQEVQQLLGSPSTVSSFGQETWYYVSARKESVAFLRPEITSQQVTRITFDASGVVAKIEDYTLKDSEQVEMVDDITPTEGQELGLWQQLLGNLGRFNKPREDAQVERRGR